jgi:hypothetical protein
MLRARGAHRRRSNRKAYNIPILNDSVENLEYFKTREGRIPALAQSFCAVYPIMQDILKQKNRPMIWSILPDRGGFIPFVSWAAPLARGSLYLPPASVVLSHWWVDERRT